MSTLDAVARDTQRVCSMGDDKTQGLDRATTAEARALRLARISLAFGRVERATRHEDGVRPETDTDHTVMLGLIEAELAPSNLDRTKIAAFALVHDLVEVYAGDTQTLTITAAGTASKRAREDAARARLVAELGEGSWIAAILTTYEEQRVPEARFVRLIDKVLPKLTHMMNGCAAALPLTDRAGFDEAHARQLRQYREEYPEFPDALDLLHASMLRAEEHWPSSDAAAPSLDAMEQRIVARDVAQGLLEGITPGPWNDTRVKWSGNGSARSHEHQLCNAQGVGVAIVTHDGSAEALANDRLHAAAPDLAASVIAQHAEFDRITDQAAAKIGESEADLSTARGEVTRLRAALASAHAIIEATNALPTDAELDAIGWWLVSGDVPYLVFFPKGIPSVLIDDEEVPRAEVFRRFAGARWLPLDRFNGFRPCARPVVAAAPARTSQAYLRLWPAASQIVADEGLLRDDVTAALGRASMDGRTRVEMTSGRNSKRTVVFACVSRGSDDVFVWTATVEGGQ